LHGHAIEQGRERQREVIGVDRRELTGLLAGDDDVPDRLPPPLVELVPHARHTGAARGQRPQVQPQPPFAAPARVGVRLTRGIEQEGHRDHLGELPRGGRDLRQALDAGGIPGVLGVAQRLGQQRVAGLEVVDDQGWAGPGALGDVGDAGVGVAALHDDVERGPQQLLAAIFEWHCHLCSGLEPDRNRNLD
jgi:hypothetical protein